jgi:hypothetical protein
MTTSRLWIPEPTPETSSTGISSKRQTVDNIMSKLLQQINEIPDEAVVQVEVWRFLTMVRCSL